MSGRDMSSEALVVIARDPLVVGLRGGGGWLYVNGVRHRLGRAPADRAGQAQVAVPPGPLRVLVASSGQRSDLHVGQVEAGDRVQLRWREALLGDAQSDILVLTQVDGPPLLAVDAGHERRRQWIWLVWWWVLVAGALTSGLAARLPLWSLVGAVGLVTFWRWRRGVRRLAALTDPRHTESAAKSAAKSAPKSARNRPA